MAEVAQSKPIALIATVPGMILEKTILTVSVINAMAKERSTSTNVHDATETVSLISMTLMITSSMTMTMTMTMTALKR